MYGVIVMLGAPLAGKGTQAKLLSDSMGIPTLSTGDLFRSEVASGSALGLKMKSFMDQGLLIPNDLTTELLESTLRKEAYHKGVILDGYPRAISHLEILEGILLRLDRELQAFVYLEIPKELLVSRLESRVTCSKCSLPFSTKNGDLQACTSCGGALIHRADDDLAVFEKRYSVFADQTLPLIAHINSSTPDRLLTFRPTGNESKALHDEIRLKLDHLVGQMDSYPWIVKQLAIFSETGSTLDYSSFAPTLLQFRNKALHENRFRKTGTALRRFVYLQTENVHKWKEHAQIFESLYGIEVLRVPPSLPEAAIKQLLLHRDKSLIPIAVIRETSNLYKPGTTILSSLRHGVSATNRSHLRAISWNVKEKKYDVREYTYETIGSIDLKRRDISLFSDKADHSKPAQGHLSANTLVSSDPSVFSWDDIFVAPNLPYTFHELRQMGFKHSARDQTVVRANYVYCLQGDDSEYKRLLGLNGKLNEAGTADCLELFKEKYMPFFVEDFRWTEHNYDNMVQRNEELHRWWTCVSPLRQFDDIPMVTVDDFLTSLEKDNPDMFDFSDKQFVDAVFEHVFDKTVAPVFSKEAEPTSAPILLFRAFTRWMTGQLAICSKFAPVCPKESEDTQQRIIAAILEARKKVNEFDLEQINRIRNIFEEYLDCLVARCLISKDDQRTFAEVFPLFDPYYVSYDKATSEYDDLKSVSQRTFSIETHRLKQYDSIKRHIGHELNAREKKCVTFMTDMIELAGGQVSDGLFVTRPGVMLLTTIEDEAWQALPHDQIMLSFLIAGVSVETSLELCAHKEARVARLTSSKTNAMSMPLFRVQGDATSPQRMYLAQAVKLRNKSLSFAQDPIEFSNMLLPAAKSTVLCYSMKLADFHKLFIGRIPEPGNENEVRQVTARMAEILHQIYPSYIKDHAAYLGASNKDKLTTLELPKPNGKMPAPVSAPTIWYHSKLTHQALRLMKRLNISSAGSQAAQWAEFRARLTYLVFQNNPTDSWTYLNNMVYKHAHTSVLDGFHVIIQLPPGNKDVAAYLIPGTDSVIVLTLKELFAEANKPNPSPAWTAIFQQLRPECPFLFAQN